VPQAGDPREIVGVFGLLEKPKVDGQPPDGAVGDLPHYELFHNAGPLRGDPPSPCTPRLKREAFKLVDGQGEQQLDAPTQEQERVHGTPSRGGVVA
jgi:hypothetical protein